MHPIQHTMCSGFVILTNLLFPQTRVLLEKLFGSQLVKKCPTLHGTQKFITTYTSSGHLSLFWASSIQSIFPHPTFWTAILRLSSHLCLGLPSSLFPSRFSHQNPVYNSHLSHTRYMPCPPHSSRFDHPNNIECEVEIMKLLLCIFLYSPISSSLLGPNILLNTLFSNTFSVSSSFN